MLTPRQLLVLNNIIEIFTRDGTPISSQSIVKKSDIQASSATIRNEMSQLEKKDLIEKVHSSSGRIPTVKGYRFYVDNLLKPKQIHEVKRIEIKDFLDKHIFQMQDVFYQSAELISKLTNYTAIVLGPQSNLSRLTAFQILALNDQQMMILLQLDNHEVQSMNFRIPKGLETEHIKQVTRFINQNLVGESLSTVYYALKNDLPKMFEKYLEMNWNVSQMLERSLQSYSNERMFVSGKPNLLDFTEDMQVAEVKNLYRLLDNEGSLLTLLKAKYDVESTFDIQIGNEFDEQLLESFSLVTVPYQDEHFGKGFIAVLGPTNMTYDSTLGVIQVLKEELLDKLEDFLLKIKVYLEIHEMESARKRNGNVGKVIILSEDEKNIETANLEESEEVEIEEREVDLEAKIEELEDQNLRLQAEIQNMRRRNQTTREEAARYRSQDLAKEILPVMDNLERALQTEVEDEEGQSLKQGVEMVLEGFQRALASSNIEVIEAKGKPFDPNFHEAIAQVPAEEGQESGIVQEVYEKGYKLHDRVLRAAKVIVTE